MNAFGIKDFNWTATGWAVHRGEYLVMVAACEGRFAESNRKPIKINFIVLGVES